jgi:hypothetical protein
MDESTDTPELAGDEGVMSLLAARREQAQQAG